VLLLVIPEVREKRETIAPAYCFDCMDCLNSLQTNFEVVKSYIMRYPFLLHSGAFIGRTDDPTRGGTVEMILLIGVVDESTIAVTNHSARMQSILSVFVTL
jgi:hypothetical protein